MAVPKVKRKRKRDKSYLAGWRAAMRRARQLVDEGVMVRVSTGAFSRWGE